MIRYPRPLPPKGFPSNAIREAERQLAANGGLAPMPEHWQRYKRHFYKAQYGKCGYCEAAVTGDVGAVEHLHPKAEVAEVLTPGQERADGTNVDGPTFRVLTGVGGFWWMAYTWENWLFACNRCNSGWKKNFFPLELPPGAPYPVLTPGLAIVRLVLAPFDDADPLEHLDFDPSGIVAARTGSSRGRVTIDVCGLHRESLRSARALRAQEATTLCDLYEALRSDGSPRADRSLMALYKMAESRRPFAGVVRCVLHTRLGIPLSELEGL